MGKPQNINIENIKKTGGMLPLHSVESAFYHLKTIASDDKNFPADKIPRGQFQSLYVVLMKKNSFVAKQGALDNLISLIDSLNQSHSKNKTHYKLVIYTWLFFNFIDGFLEDSKYFDSSSENLDMLKQLLEKGAYPNLSLENKELNTNTSLFNMIFMRLIDAGILGDFMDLKGLLLAMVEKKADINQVSDRCSALELISQTKLINKKIDLAIFLLENGFDPSKKTYMGSSRIANLMEVSDPVFVFELVSWLSKNKPDVFILCPEVVEIFSKKCGSMDKVSIEFIEEWLSRLSKAKNQKAKSILLDLALTKAVDLQDEALVERLLDERANPNAKFKYPSYQGEYVLSVVFIKIFKAKHDKKTIEPELESRIGQLKRIAFKLIRARANPNIIISGNTELTPLHFAISIGDIDLLSLLLENGADPNVQGLDGNTPLADLMFFAKENYRDSNNDSATGFIEAGFSLLIQHGADISIGPLKLGGEAEKKLKKIRFRDLQLKEIIRFSCSPAYILLDNPALHFLLDNYVEIKGNLPAYIKTLFVSYKITEFVSSPLSSEQSQNFFRKLDSVKDKYFPSNDRNIGEEISHLFSEQTLKQSQGLTSLAAQLPVVEKEPEKAGRFFQPYAKQPALKQGPVEAELFDELPYKPLGITENEETGFSAPLVWLDGKFKFSYKPENSHEIFPFERRMDSETRYYSFLNSGLLSEIKSKEVSQAFEKKIKEPLIARAKGQSGFKFLNFDNGPPMVKLKINKEVQKGNFPVKFEIKIPGRKDRIYCIEVNNGNSTILLVPICYSNKGLHHDKAATNLRKNLGNKIFDITVPELTMQPENLVGESPNGSRVSAKHR